jgi:DNA-binding response OmpR family regulator
MAAHILVVEDSRTQALRIKLELQRHGLRVEIADTGGKGLAAARSHTHDAIVLDVDLPEIDGFQLCHLLKSDPSTTHIPIVMLTARDAATDTLTGLDAGAEDYIPKDAFAEQNLVASLVELGVVEAHDADALAAPANPGE